MKKVMFKEFKNVRFCDSCNNSFEISEEDVYVKTIVTNGVVSYKYYINCSSCSNEKEVFAEDLTDRVIFKAIKSYRMNNPREKMDIKDLAINCRFLDIMMK